MTELGRAALRAGTAALLVAVLGWVLVELGPGTVAEKAAQAGGLVTAGQVDGAAARRAVIERVAAERGLDEPLAARVGVYLAGLVQLDLGRAWRGERPVAELFAEALPTTAWLVALALLAAALAGLGAAVLGASRPHSRVDVAVSAVAALALATPPVWLALVALRALAHGHPLTLFPAAGASALPVACLAAVPAAAIARHGRAALIEAAAAPWALAALGRGLDRSTLVRRHALRVAAPTLLALAPVLLAYSLAAALVVERVFAIRGLGPVVLDAAAVGDAPVVIGAAVITAAAVALCSALVDAAAARLDPRRKGSDG